jgi:hypothetical protein
MSGFSREWLALRESADHRARNVQVRTATVSAFERSEHLRIIDLACGSGSNLRALAPFLSKRQSWRLLDHDDLLLIAARETLISWGDVVLNSDPLVLRKGCREIEIVFLRADLAVSVRSAFEAPADLVTSAAFFDLVSENWIESFCDELSRYGLALNAVLTYSGEETWRPPHPADAVMLEAFQQHQSGDKGFGPAVGSRGWAIIRQRLEARGYVVTIGPSPWRLGPEDALLLDALAEGAANAVSETERVPSSVIAEWRASKRTAESYEVGHIDLFAIPSR